MCIFFLILKSLILTCIPKHEPPSHLPPQNIFLGHPHAPAPSMLHPASDIDWRFNSHDSIHVRMSFSQIIRPSPSPSESKSPLYTSVSLSLSCIQGRHCHLETGADYTEWSKPERKTPIQYTNTYIWNLGRWNQFLLNFFFCIVMKSCIVVVSPTPFLISNTRLILIRYVTFQTKNWLVPGS